MARNSGGTYSLPSGNPVTTGTTISSTTHNNTMSDIATELTDSLSRSGEGPMLAPLELVNGSVGTPALSFDSDTDCGLYRIGANNVGIAINGVKMVDLSATTTTFTGTGAGAGIAATGGSTDGTGVTGTGGGSNGKGGVFAGAGTGHGAQGTAGSGASAYGVKGIAGAGANGAGVSASTGGNSNIAAMYAEATHNTTAMYAAMLGTAGAARAAIVADSANSSGGGYALIVNGLTASNERSGLRLVPQEAPDIGQVGDLYVSSADAKLYICTVAGTPGTWVVVGTQS